MDIEKIIDKYGELQHTRVFIFVSWWTGYVRKLVDAGNFVLFIGVYVYELVNADELVDAGNFVLVIGVYVRELVNTGELVDAGNLSLVADSGFTLHKQKAKVNHIKHNNITFLLDSISPI
ncbi:hypothetical protein G9A89_003962 [Geosiphon pyriformis]|nr:hypothetical protein G9A89_003962 [Geosiphon pyriformis]